MKLRPVPTAAGRLFAKDLVALGYSQCGYLRGDILIVPVLLFGGRAQNHFWRYWASVHLLVARSVPRFATNATAIRFGASVQLEKQIAAEHWHTACLNFI